jgi:ribulose-5-phosphate 4-epimerase/fuculose-1-phosphate aldolase
LAAHGDTDVNSLWNDLEAARFRGELGARVYASRLLGQDKSLVLHGGGNTSIKIGDILYVKGSGSDLAAVDESAFTPLRLECAQQVFAQEPRDNAEMMRLLDACLARRPAPVPSIETLLHTALPFRCVDHTHADTVLAVVNTENGERIAAEVYGELAPLVPYHHSGVELARACRALLSRHGTPRTIGLALQFHGIVAFGDSAQASYENMIRLVAIAETYLKSKRAWDVNLAAPRPAPIDRMALVALRAAVSRTAGFPLVMHTARDSLSFDFSQQPRCRPCHSKGRRRPSMPCLQDACRNWAAMWTLSRNAIAITCNARWPQKQALWMLRRASSSIRHSACARSASIKSMHGSPRNATAMTWKPFCARVRTTAIAPRRKKPSRRPNSSTAASRKNYANASPGICPCSDKPHSWRPPRIACSPDCRNNCWPRAQR